MDEDAYVVGLLLTLVVLSAVPVLATGITWFSVLLLVVVWTPIIAKKAAA
jgi:hypothetical protein